MIYIQTKHTEIPQKTNEAKTRVKMLNQPQINNKIRLTTLQ